MGGLDTPFAEGDQHDATAIRFPASRFSVRGIAHCVQAALADDAKDLKGTWQVISLEANGEDKPAEEFKGWKFVFEGDQGWLIKPEETSPKFKFKLDAAKATKTIDLIVQEGDDKGKVAPGIYELDKDRLHYASTSSVIRPTDRRNSRRRTKMARVSRSWSGSRTSRAAYKSAIWATHRSEQAKRVALIAVPLAECHRVAVIPRPDAPRRWLAVERDLSRCSPAADCRPSRFASLGR